MPPRPEPDGVVRDLAQRLLTLRITVVMSSDVGMDMGSHDQETTRATLFAHWSRYLDELMPAAAAEPTAEASTRSIPTHEDFVALADRARQAHAELGARQPSSMPMGIVRRIAATCDQLSTPPKDDVAHQLMLSKALALGTDPVLLETEIHLDGDVTTRVNQAWVDEGDGSNQERMRALLEIQRLGIDAAIKWWSGLIGLVASVGRSLIELALKR